MDIKEFGNSINKILNERLTSPFYGSLIVSWLLINWKIVYLTLFVDSSEIDSNKIDYILSNYSSYWSVFIFPIVSAIVLITVMPFVTYYAYSLSLYFADKRQNRKIEVEKSQVLTVEQSLQIRSEIRNQKVLFNNLLEEKNSEIDQLKLQIEAQVSSDEGDSKIVGGRLIDSTISVLDDTNQNSILLDESITDKITFDLDFKKDFELIYTAILRGEWIDKRDPNLKVSLDSLGYLEAHELIVIKKTDNSGGASKYNFSEKGKELLKFYYEKNN